jgi:hypothetical protein
VGEKDRAGGSEAEGGVYVSTSCIMGEVYGVELTAWTRDSSAPKSNDDKFCMVVKADASWTWGVEGAVMLCICCCCCESDEAEAALKSSSKVSGSADDDDCCWCCMDACSRRASSVEDSAASAADTEN